MEGILTQNAALALLVALVPLLQVVAMPMSNCNLTNAEAVDIFNLATTIQDSPPQLEFNDVTLTFTNNKDLILEAEQYVQVGGASTIGDNCTYGSPCGLERDVHSLYPTQYHCTYDINRIPQYLCRATCEQSCNYCPPGYTCEPVYYKLPILYVSHGENCNNFLFSTHTTWSLALEDVATSCSCQRTDRCHT